MKLRMLSREARLALAALLVVILLALVVGTGLVSGTALTGASAVATNAVVGTDKVVPVYTTITTTGCAFVNNGQVLAYFKNAYTGTATITFHTTYSIGGLSLSDLTFTMTAGSDAVVGPFAPTLFNAQSGVQLGKTTVASDQAMSVTVAFLAYQ